MIHHLLWFCAVGLAVYLAVRYGVYAYLRRRAEDGILRDNGVPKPLTPLTDEALAPLQASLPVDLWRGQIMSANGGFSIDYLLILNRKKRDKKNLLVFCQGKMTVIQEGFHFLPLMEGGHVLMFNYRGVGTPGWATLKTACEDAALAHECGLRVTSHLLSGGWGPPPADQKILPEAVRRTALLGYSFGGFAAAEVASRYYVKGKVSAGVLALMSTGADMKEALIERASFVRFLFASWLLRPRLNTLATVSTPYPATKLIAHGELDQTNYPWV